MCRGVYIRHGVKLSAPELTLRGKVDSGYFSNLLDWVNRIAIRHQEEHLLLGLHLLIANMYLRMEMRKCLARSNKLLIALTVCSIRSILFLSVQKRCSFRILCLKTKMEHINVLREKIEALCLLIEDDDFTLNVLLGAFLTPWLET